MAVICLEQEESEGKNRSIPGKAAHNQRLPDSLLELCFFLGGFLGYAKNYWCFICKIESWAPPEGRTGELTLQLFFCFLA